MNNKIVPLIYDETLTNQQRLRASEINTRTDGGPTIDSAKWVDDNDHSQGLLIWLTNGRGYRLDSDGSMWALQSYADPAVEAAKHLSQSALVEAAQNALELDDYDEA